MNRRGFLGSILAAAAAPAIVRAESLMRIIVPSDEIILPGWMETASLAAARPAISTILGAGGFSVGDLITISGFKGLLRVTHVMGSEAAVSEWAVRS